MKYGDEWFKAHAENRSNDVTGQVREFEILQYQASTQLFIVCTRSLLYGMLLYWACKGALFSPFLENFEGHAPFRGEWGGERKHTECEGCTF